MDPEYVTLVRERARLEGLVNRGAASVVDHRRLICLRRRCVVAFEAANRMARATEAWQAIKSVAFVEGFCEIPEDFAGVHAAFEKVIDAWAVTPISEIVRTASAVDRYQDTITHVHCVIAFWTSLCADRVLPLACLRRLFDMHLKPLRLLVHPDKHPGSSSRLAEVSMAVNAAVDTVKRVLKKEVSHAST